MAKAKKQKKLEPFDLKKHIFSLMQGEPFYAAVSRFIEKRENINIPTACVYVNSTGNFIMEYNPKFFETLTKIQRIGVLKHEFKHIILGHVTTRCPSPKSEDLRYWNIATDLAINSIIGQEELPKECIFPGIGPFKDLKPMQAAESYLAVVKKKHKEQQNSSDHSGWAQQGRQGQKGQKGQGSGTGKKDGNGSGSDKGSSGDGRYEVAEHRIKDILRKAVNECAGGQGWGSISEAMKKEILARIKTTVDWRKVLKFFIKTSQKSEKVGSMKVINRRFPYIHSGKKIVRHARIAIGIDQSGSVSDSLLAVFFSELESLAQIAEFTVFFFDTQVDEASVFTWKKGQKVTKERTLAGGTCFDAPTKWVNERNFDGFILMTDMGAPSPGPCKVRRLWATTKGMIEDGWGHKPTRERVIFVEPPKGESW